MEKGEILRQARLFDMLSPAELEAIAELSKPCRFRAGEVIFQEGDAGDCLYVIGSGEVEVIVQDSAGAPKSLALLSAPEVFGEMSLIDKEARSATIRAHSDTSALKLTAENFNTFRSFSRDGFTFVIMNIARVLSRRLRETNGRLVTRT
jgi:CRP/FNR family cyclic AMP-dependent transcriptional regulator